MITLLLRLWFFSLEARGRFSRWDCRFLSFRHLLLPLSSLFALPLRRIPSLPHLPSPKLLPVPSWVEDRPFLSSLAWWICCPWLLSVERAEGKKFSVPTGTEAREKKKRRKADGGGCGGQTKELGGDLYKVLEADGWGVTAPSVNPSSWIWLMAFFLRWAPPSLYKQTTASASGFGFMSHLLIPHFHVFTIHFNRSIILHIYTLIF